MIKKFFNNLFDGDDDFNIIYIEEDEEYPVRGINITDGILKLSFADDYHRYPLNEITNINISILQNIITFDYCNETIKLRIEKDAPALVNDMDSTDWFRAFNQP